MVTTEVDYENIKGFLEDSKKLIGTKATDVPQGVTDADLVDGGFPEEVC